MFDWLKSKPIKPRKNITVLRLHHGSSSMDSELWFHLTELAPDGGYDDSHIDFLTTEVIRYLVKKGLSITISDDKHDNIFVEVSGPHGIVPHGIVGVAANHSILTALEWAYDNYQENKRHGYT